MSEKILTNCKLLSVPGYIGIGLSITLLLSACGAILPETNDTGRHLSLPPASQSANPADNIPSVVSPLPLVTAPQAQLEPELYTIVAQDVSVRELLFSMSRDAGINVDVNPGVTGLVTINAIDQSLPQILERISRQADIRWFFDESNNLVVEPDSPFWHTYKVDYVNVSRAAQTQAAVSTSIVSNVGGGTGGGTSAAGNNSTSSITQAFANNFWTTLTTNLSNLLGEKTETGTSASIVANPETGIISVRATARQQEQIASFINNVQSRSLYQVLIEATVVEVSLSDDYQSGVDWATIGRNGGEISFIQDLTGANLASAPRSIFTIDKTNSADAIGATISLLSQFGESRVLSSPKIMALNNQAAMLRVVDNKVYFNVGVEPGVVNQDGSRTQATYTTTVNTVPVGFVMTITPQVSESDQVTLNIRPTISRVVGSKDDPNPALAEAGVVNSIPEIQVREFESILKLFNGQVGVLGGLMQDTLTSDSSGTPGLSRLPGIRNLFSYRKEGSKKTELIIFIRPVIVREPSLTGDLQEYRNYLPTNGLKSSATIEPGQLPSLFSE